jgi:two-component system chemotaxis response regulator CheV
MIKDLLQKAGFKVEALTNGRDAWEKLLAIKSKVEDGKGELPDFVQVVISDIEMPQMDGHSLCKHIKDDSVLKKLPVLLFSSLITEKLKHKGESVGADAQIAKPEITFVATKSIALIKEIWGLG